MSILAWFLPHGCAAIGLSTGLRVACLALQVYWLIVLIRILSSWFPIPRSGPMATVVRVLYDLTDPVLRPLRNLIPPARMGMMAFDFSPILVLIGLGVLQRVIGCY